MRPPHCSRGPVTNALAVFGLLAWMLAALSSADEPRRVSEARSCVRSLASALETANTATVRDLIDPACDDEVRLATAEWLIVAAQFERLATTADNQYGVHVGTRMRCCCIAVACVACNVELISQRGVLEQIADKDWLVFEERDEPVEVPKWRHQIGVVQRDGRWFVAAHQFPAVGPKRAPALALARTLGRAGSLLNGAIEAALADKVGGRAQFLERVNSESSLLFQRLAAARERDGMELGFEWLTELNAMPPRVRYWLACVLSLHGDRNRGEALMCSVSSEERRAAREDAGQ